MNKETGMISLSIIRDMNNKIRIIIYCISLLMVCYGCLNNCKFFRKASGEEYFISPTGDDNNPGTMRRPWKTLQRINQVNLNPGANVFLEGGMVFQGPLLLDSLDKGLPEKKVTVSSYRRGRATIDGRKTEGIIIDNCEHLTVKNLVVKGLGRKDGNVTDGIYVTSSKFFDLDSLEVYGFQHSGVRIHKVKNVNVRHINAHNNGFAGINVTGTTKDDPTNYDNENIYIGYCSAENNPGDPSVPYGHSGNGILASSVRNGTIEYCEAFNNGWDMIWTGNGPVGIWIWDCTNFTIQYCIAHNNKTNPVAADGGGFDLDGGVSNSIIQYCLSYNNQGAGIGLFEFGAAKSWENNMVRYNISYNDGIINAGSLAIWKNETRGTMRNCDIYNNTFFNDTARGVSIWVYNNWPGFNFRNNLFIYKGSFLYPGQKLVTELFQRNCYWNLSGNQSIAGYKNLVQWAKGTGNEMLEGKFIGIFSDPCIVNPGIITLTDSTMILKENLAGFYLKSGSPLIDQGLDLKELFNMDVVKKDISGMSLPQGNGFDVGALEFREN